MVIIAINPVPRASFPLTSGRKTRTLGATISGMRYRCRSRCRLRSDPDKENSVTLSRDGGELERALVDVTGTGKTVWSYCEKQFWEKTLQKTLKISDCRESIRKQIRSYWRKIFRVRFVFLWFPESNALKRFERTFGLRPCLGKELPPLWNFIRKAKKNCRARKSLGRSLALQHYAVLVSSGFFLL